MDDPATLDVEVDMDAEAFRHEVQSAKRELHDVRSPRRVGVE